VTPPKAAQREIVCERSECLSGKTPKGVSVSKRNKKFLIYLLILLLPFSFFFLRPETFTPFRMSIVELATLPVKIILFPFSEIKKILLYRSTYNKYRRLQEEANVLRSQVLERREIIQENVRLKQLFDFKRSFIFSSIAANVIGRDPTNWSSSIVIDRGKKDGLQPGMPVVNSLGVVGKVSEVGNSTSRVLLLTDLNFSVAALVQRNRENGLVAGTLTGTCRMKYLSYDANVKVGDRVITSKLSSTFPEGLLIGVVTQVEESQSSPTLECLVKPAVRLSQVEEVLVILNSNE